jgi:hypothetical protein
MKARLINYVFNLIVEYEVARADSEQWRLKLSNIETREFTVRVEAQACRERAVAFFWRNQQGLVADALGTTLDKVRTVKIQGIAVAA